GRSLSDTRVPRWRDHVAAADPAMLGPTITTSNRALPMQHAADPREVHDSMVRLSTAEARTAATCVAPRGLVRCASLEEGATYGHARTSRRAPHLRPHWPARCHDAGFR